MFYSKHVIIMSMIFTFSAFTCPPKHVFQMNDDLTTKCAFCPPNCSICYFTLSKVLNCGICSEGYYLNDNRQCERCFENCKNCIGPELKQCKEVEHGYFYDVSVKSIKSCEVDGCAKCTEKNKCNFCKDGYYPLQIEDASQTSAEKVQTDSLTCKKCNNEKCIHCAEKKDQIKNNVFTGCSLCQSGFTSVSGDCQKCPENCASCKDETKECSYCENSFFLKKSENICEKGQIDHCLIPLTNGSCNTCESHYFLNSLGKCEFCATKLPRCGFCTQRNNEVVCLACQSGNYMKGEICTQCPENCLRCQESKCESCAYGYFHNLETNNCDKCAIKNCDLCKSASECSSCKDGFYFNTTLNMCSSCNDNCLVCHDDSEQCPVCSLEAFQFQEEIVSHQKAQNDFFMGFLGLFMGLLPPLKNISVTQIQVISSCVKECPSTHKGKTITTDFIQRKCVGVEQINFANLFFPSIHHDDDLHEKIRTFKTRYNEEIEKIKKNSLANKREEQSLECFYNGILRRIVEADRAAYFVCRCTEGYMGDNCQITADLYNETQKKLLEFCDISEKQFINHNQHHKKKFLSTLIHITKFRIGLHVIRRLLQLIQLFMEVDIEIDNRKGLYVLYDSILLALYDIIEEIRKSKNNLEKIEIGVQEKERETYELIHQTIEKLETSLEDHKYTNSFLEENSLSYKSLDTFSFIIGESKISNYDENGFSFRTPNIDTSYNVAAKNSVILAFKLEADLQKIDTHLQVIGLSSSLFSDRIGTTKHKPVTNLMYMRFINPQKLHQPVSIKETGISGFTLEFALNYIPTFENLEEKMICVAFYFENPLMNREGEVRRGRSNDDSTVICWFKADFEPNKYYFVLKIRE